MKFFQKSIKSIFRFSQICIGISVLFCLVVSIILSTKLVVNLRAISERNVALSNVFSYPSEYLEQNYQYIIRMTPSILDNCREIQKNCMKELDSLIVNVKKERTYVMIKGLRNMYEKLFERANLAIDYIQEGNFEDAYTEYYNAVFYSNLINDVISSMYSLYTEDLNAYLSDEFHNSQRSVIIVFIGQIIVSLFVLILLYEVSKGIKSKTSNLSQLAKDIADPNYDTEGIVFDTDSENELDYLGVNMIEMSNKIKTYISIIQEKDKLMLDSTLRENEYLKFYSAARESEVKALNSQINPHFLYNTLSIVSQLCYLERAPKACQMLDAIIDTFQYITRTSNSITDLYGEISFLKNYFYICGIRYENRISFTMNVEEDLPNIKLPGLTFQPLVENAILHGLEKTKQDGSLNVEIYRKEDSIRIDIEDNGIGMGYEKVEEYISDAETNEHIGLRNVTKRLKLYFGEEAKISVSSEENCGTVISILLPI